MIDNPFGPLAVQRKRGDEPLHNAGTPLGPTLLHFWQWMASDLANNAMRGTLAEFLVATALGAANGTRVEWDAYDIRTPSGLKVEVKSAAYLQSWAQSRPSTISFAIPPTFGWDAEANTVSAERRRQADLYVFALLAHREKATLDPLDVSQWRFFVLPTAVLDARFPTQKTITLSTLLYAGATEVRFDTLRDTVEAMGVQG